MFQIEYAQKAVDSENSGYYLIFFFPQYYGIFITNSSTAVAFRVKDGIVFGIEKLIVSKMLVPGSNRRISAVSNHAGMVTCSNLARRLTYFTRPLQV